MQTHAVESFAGSGGFARVNQVVEWVVGLAAWAYLLAYVAIALLRVIASAVDWATRSRVDRPE